MLVTDWSSRPTGLPRFFAALRPELKGRLWDRINGDDVNAIYPPPSIELMYRQSMSFVDSSPELGHTFPGFPLEVPTLE